jgi:hypothetical protein
MRFFGHFRYYFFCDVLKANGRAAISHSPVLIFASYSQKNQLAEPTRQPEDRKKLQLKQGSVC